MKLLIIGGMGIIGGAVTEAALERGCEVTVLSRSNPSGKWKDIPARYIRGNWYDDSLAESIVSEGYDVVIDTVVFDEKQMERSARIAEGHCKQFIFISTDSVYPRPGSAVTEDAYIDKDAVKWNYGINKYKAELFLKEHSSEYSFYWTVIRPTITFGDTRLPVGFASRRNTCNLIDRLVNGKPILRFEDQGSKHAICHVSVFGAAVAGLLLNEQASGQCYHISDDKAYTFDEIFGVLEQILGVKGRYVHLPAEAVSSIPWIYEDMIYDKDSEFTLDNSKIKAVCSEIDYSCDLNRVLTGTVRYLEENKGNFEQDSEYDMITDLVLLRNSDKLDRKDREYVTGFSKEYIQALKRSEQARNKHKRIEKIKDTLRPIKHKLMGH